MNEKDEFIFENIITKYRNQMAKELDDLGYSVIIDFDVKITEGVESS